MGVYFGSPGVEADDPYFGGVGPRRTGCISCGNCNIGCGHNAKNKLTTNYLYLAEKLGVEVHELQEVHEIIPLEGGGFELHARHPGWAQRATRLRHRRYTAEQVIVAAHAYGSSKLLHHMQHKGRLTGLSGELGKRARTNSEQLLGITRTDRQWHDDPDKIQITPGSVSITSGVWPDEVTSIEPTIWGVGSDVFAFLVTYHQHGEQKHPTASWLKELLGHPGEMLGLSDPRHWSERTSSCSVRRRLTPRSSSTGTTACCEADTATARLLGAHPDHRGLCRPRRTKMDSGEAALLFEVINRNASAHFIGGIPIGDSSESALSTPTSACSASLACT